MSKGEIILTAIAFIVCVWHMNACTIPHLIEWLDTMSIDDTTEGSDHHDE